MGPPSGARLETHVMPYDLEKHPPEVVAVGHGLDERSCCWTCGQPSESNRFLPTRLPSWPTPTPGAQAGSLTRRARSRKAETILQEPLPFRFRLTAGCRGCH